MIKTRKQYMAGEINHHDYYSQFVSDRMINYVVRLIGKNRLLASTDEHMNDIPLFKWDQLSVRDCIASGEDWKTASLSTYSKEVQEKRPFMWSMADNVCLAKTAARIWIESNKKEV